MKDKAPKRWFEINGKRISMATTTTKALSGLKILTDEDTERLLKAKASKPRQKDGDSKQKYSG